MRICFCNSPVVYQIRNAFKCSRAPAEYEIGLWRGAGTQNKDFRTGYTTLVASTVVPQAACYDAWEVEKTAIVHLQGSRRESERVRTQSMRVEPPPNTEITCVTEIGVTVAGRPGGTAAMR